VVLEKPVIERCKLLEIWAEVPFALKEVLVGVPPVCTFRCLPVSPGAHRWSAKPQ